MSTIAPIGNDPSIPSSTECYFDTLPDQILIIIFSKLNVYSCLQIGVTCRKFNQIQNDEKLWKLFVYQHLESQSINKQSHINFWKNFYRNTFYQSVHSPEKTVQIAQPTQPVQQVSLKNDFSFSHVNFKWDNHYDWQVKYTLSTSIRKYSFYVENVNGNSTCFTHFFLEGFSNGKIRLSITVQGNLDFIKKYFYEAFSRDPEIFSVWESYKIEFSDEKEIKTAFSIIKTYSTIPKEHEVLIEKIIAAGNWNNVTPLLDSEKEKLKEAEEKYLAKQNPSFFNWLFQFFIADPKNIP